MTKQLDDTLLIGYIHGTLSPQEQTEVEELLRSSEFYRKRLALLRHWQRKIKNELSAEINRPPIPATLNFATIAPQLVNRRKPRPRMASWMASFAAMAAVFVLAIALVYSTYKRPIITEGTNNSTQMTPAGLVIATPIPFETTFPVNHDPAGKSSLPSRTPESKLPDYPAQGLTIPTRTPVPTP